MINALKQLPGQAPLVVSAFKFMESTMVSEWCHASEFVDRGAPAASMAAMKRHMSSADLQVSGWNASNVVRWSLLREITPPALVMCALTDSCVGCEPSSR